VTWMSKSQCSSTANIGACIQHKKVNDRKSWTNHQYAFTGWSLFQMSVAPSTCIDQGSWERYLQLAPESKSIPVMNECLVNIIRFQLDGLQCPDDS
jgi:hypothetical protein